MCTVNKPSRWWVALLLTITVSSSLAFNNPQPPTTALSVDCWTFEWRYCSQFAPCTPCSDKQCTPSFWGVGHYCQENESRRINPPTTRTESRRRAGLNEQGRVAFDPGQTIWCYQAFPCDKVTKCTVYQGNDPLKFGKYYCAQDDDASPLGSPVGWQGWVLKGKYCWGT